MAGYAMMEPNHPIPFWALGTGKEWPRSDASCMIRRMQEVSEPRHPVPNRVNATDDISGTWSHLQEEGFKPRLLWDRQALFFSRQRTLSTVYQILSPHSWRHSTPHSTLNTPEDTPLHTQPPNTTTCSVVLHGLFLTLTLTRTPASPSMLPLKVHSDILVPRVKLTTKHYLPLILQR